MENSCRKEIKVKKKCGEYLTLVPFLLSAYDYGGAAGARIIKESIFWHPL